MTTIDGRPSGAPACWAPSTGLYFEPTGQVSACCASSFALGRIGTGPGRTSLAEIWDSALRRAQQDALDADDYSLGCQACGISVASGNREASTARWFDEYADAAPLDRPVFLDFALSNRCNLQCVMCNGDLSSSIRHLREHRPPLPEVYDDRFFEELRAFLPGIRRATFKGGEPFLAPEAERVWDLIAELAPACEVAVVTNGTIWNDRVERLVRDLRMEIQLSVDGMTPDTLEAIRVGVVFDRLWGNIDRFQALAEELDRPMTLSYCVVRQNWHELLAFLLECDRRGVQANVNVVTQPTGHSVLGLPRRELDAVNEALAETDRASAHLLGPSRPIWDQTLAQLHAFGATPVAITAHASSSSPGADALARVRADVAAEGLADPLRPAASAEPLVLETAFAEITGVMAAPDWSAVLPAEGWTGRRTMEILDLVAEAVGGALPPEVVQRVDGSFRSEVVFTDDGRLPFTGLVAFSYPPPEGRLAPQLIALLPTRRAVGPAAPSDR